MPDALCKAERAPFLCLPMPRKPLPTGSLIRYFLIIQSYAGFRFNLLVGMATVAALLDGIGITMLLPLLENSGIGSGGSNAGELFDRVLRTIGIEANFNNLLLVMAAIFILKGLFKLLEGMANARIVADLFTQWRKELLQRYSQLSYVQFMERNSGHFINIINAQINTSGMFIAMFASFLSRLLTMLVYLGFVLLLSPRFTLYAALVGILVAVLLRSLMAKTKEVSRQYAAENGVLNAFLIQVFQAYKYLKGTGRFGALQEQADGSIDRLRNQRLKAGNYNAVMRAIQEPVAILSMLAVLYFYVGVQGYALAPILVTLMLFYRTLNTLMLVQSEWQQLLNISGGLDAVVAEFDFVNRIPPAEAKPRFEAASNQDIHFEGVGFAYGENKVLDKAQVRIPANATTALVGPSGSGKTTFTDLLIGLLEPTEGAIVYGGNRLDAMDLEQWHRRIGYVTQDNMVFDDTIANNITLWSGDYAHDATVREAVEEAAAMANALEFIQAMPEGFATNIGERGVKLSGGQRQRLAIARELYKKPEILVLDEATSALDSDSEQLVQQSLQKLHGNLTVVMIAHRLATTKDADLVVVLDQGRIIEQGAYRDLAAGDGVFRGMLQKQGIQQETAKS